MLVAARARVAVRSTVRGKLPTCALPREPEEQEHWNYEVGRQSGVFKPMAADGADGQLPCPDEATQTVQKGISCCPCGYK